MKPNKQAVSSRLGHRHLPLFLLLLALLTVVGCSGGGSKDAGPASNPAGGKSTSSPVPAAGKPANAASTGALGAGKDQNACHLLDQVEVSALVDDKIVMRDQTEAGDTWSTCSWETEKGVSLFSMTVYWSKGKQEWETWRMAQGAGNQAVKQAEGVGAGNVVKSGLVAGIGDGAYFSKLLPSLVLKGDTLFEMNLFSVTNPETKFAGLAQKLLAKIQ